jgi:carbonic anhydrase
MKRYQEIFEYNRKWVEAKLAEDPRYFTEMSKDQKPDFLYIGCADSRVPANQIMGVEPGEVFVHRNIANLVVNTDLNVQSVVHYAVEFLKVKHIIVCGHYGCGGIRAAMQSKDLGILNGWLREIRDVYRLHKDELLKIEDEEKRYERLIELNVQEQCVNILKIASVQKSYYHNEFPSVHGWVYDLKSGRLKDLEINQTKLLQGIQEIYDLREE